MANNKDILLGEDNDLLIEDGDFVFGDGTLQHQLHIIRARKGEYKRTPEVGVGIGDELSNSNPRDMFREIKKQLQYDGSVVDFVGFAPNGNLIIDAYEKD